MKIRLAIVLFMACLFAGPAGAVFIMWDDTLYEEDVMEGVIFQIGHRIVEVAAC